MKQVRDYHILIDAALVTKNVKNNLVELRKKGVFITLYEIDLDKNSSKENINQKKVEISDKLRVGEYADVIDLTTKKPNELIYLLEDLNMVYRNINNTAEINYRRAGYLGLMISVLGALVGGLVGMVTCGPVGAAVGAAMGGMFGATAPLIFEIAHYHMVAKPKAKKEAQEAINKLIEKMPKMTDLERAKILNQQPTLKMLSAARLAKNLSENDARYSHGVRRALNAECEESVLNAGGFFKKVSRSLENNHCTFKRNPLQRVLSYLGFFKPSSVQNMAVRENEEQCNYARLAP